MTYSKIELNSLIEDEIDSSNYAMKCPPQEAQLTMKGGANLMMRVDKLIELDNVEERIAGLKAIFSSINQIKKMKMQVNE